MSGYFLFVLGLVGAPAVVFATRYLAQDATGRVTAGLTGVFLLILALVLCARDPLTFLAAWELMTLVPAAIILVGAARPGGPELRVRLHRAHAPHGRGHLDRRAAARRRGSVRWGRGRDGVEHADRDRRRGAHRHGDESRARAAAHVAPPRASDRARSRVRADEWRDDQDGRLRPRPSPRRVARRAADVVRRGGRRGGWRVRRDRRRLRDLPARAEAAARVPLDRERRDHRARARRLPPPAHDRRRRVGRSCARGRAAAHAQPRRLQGRSCSSGRARSRRPRGRWRSIASAGSSSGCPGREAHSSSVRWRSQGSRR